MPFYSQAELRELGLKDFGERVKVSCKASLYGMGEIAIADDSRIDDFCIISTGAGGVSIGRYVHVAAYSSLIGRARIVLSDFCNISSRVSIYSNNDDYSGEWLTNPTVPAEFTNVTCAEVLLGRHVIVGAGAIILPGVVVGEGAAIGALSFVKESCDPFSIYVGSPARKIRERSRNLLEIESKLERARNGIKIA